MILYTCLFRANDVTFLCEVIIKHALSLTESKGLRSDITKVIKQISHNENMTVVQISENRKCFIFIKDNIGVAAVTDVRGSSAVLITFLDKVYSEMSNVIMRNHSGYTSIRQASQQLRPYELSELERIISRIAMLTAEQNVSSRLINLKNSLDEVQSTMQNSLKELILRGDSLNQLNDKAFDLQDCSARFADRAKSLALKAEISAYLPIIAVVVIAIVALWYFIRF